MAYFVPFFRSSIAFSTWFARSMRWLGEPVEQGALSRISCEIADERTFGCIGA